MKLYYHPFSPFARKPRLAAALLGIELETEKVDLFAGEGQRPEFLKLNPQGKVPTLTDGDFSLWESNAIVLYLASKAAKSPLWPDDARSRADILRWQFWETSSWAPACMVYLYENILKSMLGRGDPDAEELKKADEKFHRCAKLLNDHLAKQAWLVGDSMTLADISVAPTLMHAESAKYPLAGYDHIRAWFDKIRQLPAWTSTEPSA
ncbi:glutathione S-transferase family protein [Methylocaldum szegediense]|uniref:Glutathione S-transferase n=1 Tax=Methylocaldum szegediense TaxID=73780 RepID=A0ABM9I0N4_9GAMM|nr:glutathione S-transferase family protein [Methylocaldum szegediense]CAI8812744.1 glutathione S-transferase [Methylocaldum szegediense]